MIFYFLFLFSRFLGVSQPMMVCSNFLKFFAIFLEFSITGRVGTHWNDFFYFLSFLAFPILYWLEKKLWWCFLIFWFFLLFFFEFSILSCVETHRNDFYYFLSFTAFPNLFWLEKKLWWCFLIFFNLFAIFLEFSITIRVGTHRNDFFFSSFLGLFQLILAWK